MSDRRNHRGTVDVKEDVRFKKYVTSPPLMTVEWLFDEVKKLVDYLWNLTDEIADIDRTVSWGDVDGDLVNQADLQTELDKVGVNASTIAANSGDIATNATDISANAAAISSLQDGAVRRFLHVRHEENSGIASGTFTSGAWQTRRLNTVKTNTITGASLSANQITLPTGSYSIRIYGKVQRIAAHQMRLQSVSGTPIDIVGLSSNAPDSSYVRDTAVVSSVITLGEATVLQVTHRSSRTRTGNGFGTPVNFGEKEVYAEVMIEKLS